jgi:hypothetical protein
MSSIEQKNILHSSMYREVLYHVKLQIIEQVQRILD